MKAGVLAAATCKRSQDQCHGFSKFGLVDEQAETQQLQFLSLSQLSQEVLPPRRVQADSMPDVIVTRFTHPQLQALDLQNARGSI